MHFSLLIINIIIYNFYFFKRISIQGVNTYNNSNVQSHSEKKNCVLKIELGKEAYIGNEKYISVRFFSQKNLCNGKKAFLRNKFSDK